MQQTFIAETITRTQRRNGSGRLEITFTDAQGHVHTVSLTGHAARSLSGVLQEFGGQAPADGPTATKMPREFSVGQGRFEPVVLVRFEDDVPYGLDAGQAAGLGRALIEEAARVAQAPGPRRQ